MYRMIRGIIFKSMIDKSEHPVYTGYIILMIDHMFISTFIAESAGAASEEAWKKRRC